MGGGDREPRGERTRTYTADAYSAKLRDLDEAGDFAAKRRLVNARAEGKVKVTSGRRG